MSAPTTSHASFSKSSSISHHGDQSMSFSSAVSGKANSKFKKILSTNSLLTNNSQTPFYRAPNTSRSYTNFYSSNYEQLFQNYTNAHSPKDEHDSFHYNLSSPVAPYPQAISIAPFLTSPSLPLLSTSPPPSSPIPISHIRTPPPTIPIPVKSPSSSREHGQTVPNPISHYSWTEQTKKAEAYVAWNQAQAKKSGLVDGMSVSQANLEGHELSKEFEEKYTLEEEIGVGGTAFVMSAIRNDNGTVVAVKFMFKDRIAITNWKRDRTLGTVPMEIFILKRLEHDNVIKFLDAYEDSKFFYLVMESLHSSETIILPHPNSSHLPAPTLLPLTQNSNSFGLSAPGALQMTHHNNSELDFRHLVSRRVSRDLFEAIERNRFFPESQVRNIFAQIVNAIAYLHLEKNIVHRDLKDENIIVEENLRVKLIDFGTAWTIPTDKSEYFDTYSGTKQYASPEIIRGERYEGPPQDIWALGVLLFVLAFGEYPFVSDQATVMGKFRNEKIGGRSKDCIEVLSGCLCPDLEKRWTVREIQR
ncbi:hypothetical protein HK096_000700, partial [Nowakowskiella sp. JEL0078]